MRAEGRQAGRECVCVLCCGAVNPLCSAHWLIVPTSLAYIISRTEPQLRLHLECVLQLAALDLRRGSCAPSDTVSDTPPMQCAIFISLFAAAFHENSLVLVRRVFFFFLLHNLPARQIYGQIRTDSMRLDRSVTGGFFFF